MIAACPSIRHPRIFLLSPCLRKKYVVFHHRRNYQLYSNKINIMDYTNSAQLAIKCDQVHALLSNPQKFLITAHSENDDSEIKSEVFQQKKELSQVIQYFFGYLEFLAGGGNEQHQPNKNRHNETNSTVTFEAPLSGLSELFVGENDENQDSSVIDAETIWGQVDIQNLALLRKLKHSTKKLTKAADTYFSSGQDSHQIKVESNEKHLIRLVDLKDVSEEQHSEEDIAADDSDGIVDENDHYDEEQEEDASGKRIRERMERTMAQMIDEDSQEISSDDSDEKKAEDDMKEGDSNSNINSDEMVDEAAEVLNDGFFNLHDMEAFADSEEEYHMPVEDDEREEEVTKARKKKKQNKKTYEFSSDEEDDQEEKLVMNFRRKKFREDEEIDALLSLYDDNGDGAEDEEDAIINMTAADFFGRPQTKYLNKQKEVAKNKRQEVEAFSDNDSWGEQEISDNAEENGWNVDRSDEDFGTNEEEIKRDANNETKNDKPQSSKKQKLDDHTKQLESEMLAEKPWAMRGEASGSARPLNSLLEATPQFEVNSKVAPIVTKEHSEVIENMIMQRIILEDWDDVIPRELHSKITKIEELPEVSQEKSKLGLGELYERDYLKKSAGYDVEAVKKSTVEEKAKDEMRKLFASLCSKLDALSNYNFAPRPLEEEAEIHVVTTPAIAMEEILPLHVSESRAVAPEEVYATKKGRESVLKGEREHDQTERKSTRNAKKTARRKARKAKLADEKVISRLQPANSGLSNPYEKRKLREEFSKARAYGKVVAGKKDKHTDYNTSTKFFQRMQEDVQKDLEDENGIQSRKRMKNSDSDKDKKSSALKL